jgi:electron transfer flavoprotein alpha subunit
MNIIVCVKQVPDVAELKFDNQRKVLIREGVKNVLNPFDRRAIAEAIRIRSKIGGEVTAMTMGPPQATEALFECLAVGADKAVHLVDRAFAGADTLATARTLVLALKRMPFDLIMCGRHSVDAETGQVGPEIAELLGIPHVTGVSSLSFDCEPGFLIAERETDEGFETIECKLPALITAAERLGRPVKISEADLEAVRDRPVEVVTAADLSADESMFGIAGSPTSVSQIFSLEKTRHVEMIAGGVEQIAEDLAKRLCVRGLFCGWEQLESTNNPVSARREVFAPGKAIWAVGELTGGELRHVSFELLGKGQELAQKVGGELAAVLIGNNISRHAGELAAHGADRVYLIEGERFAEYNPIHYAAALTEAIEQLRPHAVLIPSTANGRDYAPRVAGRLGLGLTGDCVDLDVNERGELIQYKPAFGGQIIAPIFSRTYPQMATVRPGMLARLQPDHSRSCPVQFLEVGQITDNRYRVLASSNEVGSASTELDDAEVVVCVGMGVGGPENMPVINSLARVLDAAVGATRRVVDKGWIARQQQIGLTGRAVAPNLFFAIGVRGAFNHTIGIQRAGIIVAINNDPHAEIFEVADYGIEADYAEIVPALTASFARRKAQMAGASR